MFMSGILIGSSPLEWSIRCIAMCLESNFNFNIAKSPILVFLIKNLVTIKGAEVIHIKALIIIVMYFTIKKKIRKIWSIQTYESYGCLIILSIANLLLSVTSDIFNAPQTAWIVSGVLQCHKLAKFINVSNIGI